MENSSKGFGSAALILLATLALGIVIGVLGSASLKNVRERRLNDARGDGGFVAHMMRIIEPTAEQRAQLRPLIQETDRQNRQIRETANQDLRQAIEDMQESLAPYLTEEQQARLADFIRRPPPPGGQGGPIGVEGGGPPRPGPGGARPGGGRPGGPAGGPGGGPRPGGPAGG